MSLGALQEIVVETKNPAALARFWQAMIGGEVEVDGDEWAALDSDEVYVVFVYSPERPPSRTGIRFTVDVDDLASATAHAEDLGAAKHGAATEDEEGASQSMIDPGGFAFTLTSQGG